MLLLTVILGLTALIVAVLRLVASRMGLPRVRRSVMVIGLVAGVGGIALATGAFERIVERFEQRNWPTTVGAVNASTITGERSFAPRITYEFTVHGNRFTGTSDRNVPLFGNKRRNMEVAMKETAEYPAGTRVIVYYAPENPNRSTIMPEPRWNDYAQSGLGVFIFGGGFFLALLPRAPRRMSNASHTL